MRQGLRGQPPQSANLPRYAPKAYLACHGPPTDNVWQGRPQAAVEARNQPTRIPPRAPIGLLSPHRERHSCPGRPRPHQPRLWQKSQIMGPIGPF